MASVKINCTQCGQKNWTSEEFCSNCSNPLYENCNSARNLSRVDFDNFYNLFSW